MRVPWYLMAKGKGGGGYKTASGPIVSVSDAKAAPLRSLVANIEPVQAGSGDPSPTNIRPITGWTACNVYSTGAIHHYGAVWDTVNASMTRTGDAANITTNTANFKHSGSVNPNYSNPFDSIYPWSGRKLCNISLTDYMALQSGDSITDCVTYWEGEAGFSYTDADGVWVYTPDFYGISYWQDGKRYFDVCDTPLPGYRHYPAQISARWRGTTESRTIGGTSKTILLSKPGMPAKNVAVSTIHTYAKNGGMSLDSIYSIDASNLLYLIEYANYNAQSAIGNGVSDLYDQASLHPDSAVTAGNTVQFTGLTAAQLADFIPNAIIDFGTSNGGANTKSTYITAVETTSGVTTVTLADAVTITTDTFVSIHGRINYADAEIGSMSGYIGTNGKTDAYYRGEALWGNMFYYVLGAYKSDTEHVWLAEEGTEDNYDALDTSVHTDTGIILSSTANYIKTLAWPDTLGTLSACALCTEVGGNSANPVGDYFYTSTGSNRILIIGGHASYGTTDGPFCWYWSYMVSASYWYLSGRPLLKAPVQGGI